jgi:aspartyl-tRNA(Asn)/glutamyl-tRNA(Gln) amidotransferase subunit C
MSVSPEEVAKIAALAELRVDEDQVAELADQMSRILEYVVQLGSVVGTEARPFLPGPDAVRFRPDEVKPIPLAFGPDVFAPEFRAGFFLVPKLGQFEGSGGET